MAWRWITLSASLYATTLCAACTPSGPSRDQLRQNAIDKASQMLEVVRLGRSCEARSTDPEFVGVDDNGIELRIDCEGQNVCSAGPDRTHGTEDDGCAHWEGASSAFAAVSGYYGTEPPEDLVERVGPEPNPCERVRRRVSLRDHTVLGVPAQLIEKERHGWTTPLHWEVRGSGPNMPVLLEGATELRVELLDPLPDSGELVGPVDPSCGDGEWQFWLEGARARVSTTDNRVRGELSGAKLGIYDNGYVNISASSKEARPRDDVPMPACEGEGKLSANLWRTGERVEGGQVIFTCSEPMNVPAPVSEDWLTRHVYLGRVPEAGRRAGDEEGG